MLISDLFTFLSVSYEEGMLEASIKINPAHGLFKGHFPNQPVTPGVVQVQLVKELLESQLNKKLELKTLGRCKFLAVLDPNHTPEIDVLIKVSEADGVVKVNASAKKEETTFFKFSASYQ